MLKKVWMVKICIFVNAITKQNVDTLIQISNECNISFIKIFSTSLVMKFPISYDCLWSREMCKSSQLWSFRSKLNACTNKIPKLGHHIGNVSLKKIQLPFENTKSTFVFKNCTKKIFGWIRKLLSSEYQLYIP